MFRVVFDFKRLRWINSGSILLEKCMNKWRTEERRSRKESFAVARENEKVQDATTTAEVTYSVLTSNANLNKDAAKVSIQSNSFCPQMTVFRLFSWKTRKGNWKSRWKRVTRNTIRIASGPPEPSENVWLARYFFWKLLVRQQSV